MNTSLRFVAVSALTLAAFVACGSDDDGGGSGTGGTGGSGATGGKGGSGGSG
ncbi:MAG: hypothetical protein HYZ29_30560, partial [Myxococcales bacterium]|nr:hypothetical protein [Myxococcales bacterium]